MTKTTDELKPDIFINWPDKKLHRLKSTLRAMQIQGFAHWDNFWIDFCREIEPRLTNTRTPLSRCSEAKAEAITVEELEGMRQEKWKDGGYYDTTPPTSIQDIIDLVVEEALKEIRERLKDAPSE